MRAKTLAALIGALLCVSLPAAATPIPGMPNEIANGTFDDSLNNWEFVPGDVTISGLGNPGPAAQCLRTTAVWGDRMRQVVDNSKFIGWDPALHAKMVDLQADISILVKSEATGGGVRFRLDYWDEIYNTQDTPPSPNDPGYHVTNWEAYYSSQTISFTTVNPFNQIVLPIQPRWLSVEIEFLQPTNVINLVDNVVLTSKCIPEPSVMTALIAGLAGLSGLRLFRRK